MNVENCLYDLLGADVMVVVNFSNGCVNISGVLDYSGSEYFIEENRVRVTFSPESVTKIINNKVYID